MQTDETRDQLQDQDLGLELELCLCVLDVLGEEALSEALGVMQKVECGEVQRVGRVLLLFLSLDCGGSLLEVAGLLLRLFVDARLVLQLGHVNVLLVTALVGRLLSLLVAAEEKAYSSGNDLLVLAQGGQAHDLDGARIGPYLLLPQLACDLDGPEALGRLLVRLEQVVEDRLYCAVELVVRGLDVRGAQVGEDLGEEQLAQRLAGRCNEDGEERVEQRHRVDDVLVAQQTQAPDDLVAQLVLEHLVVLQEDLLQVGGELRGEVRIQVGHVRDKLDQVLQVGQPGALHRGVLQEQVAQRLVLLPLVVEVVAVALRVALDLEAERGMVRLNLLESADLALHFGICPGAVEAARVVGCAALAFSNFSAGPSRVGGRNRRRELGRCRFFSGPDSSITHHPGARAFPFLSLCGVICAGSHCDGSEHALFSPRRVAQSRGPRRRRPP